MLEALRWPEPQSPSAWCDQHRYLDSRTTALPGRWSTARVPYAREWIDSAGLSWVRQVTIQASTQVGKTEALLCMAAWATCEDPGPMVWVLPTREEAESFGADRVLPMVEATPRLREQMGGERWDAKKRQVRFRRSTLWLRTSRTPAELASKAARRVFGDEVNKWPSWTQKEAGPWELLTERTRTFPNHLRVCTSTPTLPDGLVSKEHAKGDRRSYWVPCPACGHHQVLVWGRVKWPKEVDSEEAARRLRQAWYECEQCQAKLDDRQRVAMVAAGVWVPAGWSVLDWLNKGAAADRAPHRSYHLWAAYSPWVQLWEIVAQHLRSAGDPGLAMNFCNSWLGEVWQEKIEDATDDQARASRRPYARGTTPEGPMVVVAGVDTQAHYLPFVVRGFGMDGNSWLLDHGRAETFVALEAALFRQDWSRGDQRRPFLSLRLVLVDARYREGDAVDFARKWGGLVKLTKGSEFGDARTWGSVHTLERHPVTGAPLRGDGVQLWSVNTGAFKDRYALALRRAAEGATTRAAVCYQDVDSTYLAEITSEHKVTVRTQRGVAERWVKKPGRRANHYLDTEALAFAAADLLRVDQLRANAAAQEGRERNRREPRGDDGAGDGPRLWRRR